jgi:hypothetical protein
VDDNTKYFKTSKRVVFCYCFSTIYENDPCEHEWVFIGSKVNHHNPQCQNTAELINAILKKWRRFQQERFCRLVLGMNRDASALAFAIFATD